MRMLAPALRRNIAGTTFENFQQRLLHPLAAHVARDRNVVRFTPDFVDLVNVNDADLRAFHVVVRILQQTQNDVFNVFAHVARFSQGCRIGNAKWDIENFCERFRQQSFARSGRSD